MIAFDPTFDYGSSDLTIEYNKVCWKFSELIKTLITLSSSADRQIEIMGIGLATDEMAIDFDSYFTLSYKQYVGYQLINSEIVAKLHFLDYFLDQRSGDNDPDFWNETALSTNSDWQNVRIQAKEILVLMGFDNLDLDFERTEKYEKFSIVQKLVSQATRTRLIMKK